MDLTQRKLTRSEWDSIEVPVSREEIAVLQLIINGYTNVSIRYNPHNSLFTLLKIEYSKQMEDHLFNKFFAKQIDDIIVKYDASYLQIEVKAKIVINKADSIRIDRNTQTLTSENVYELLLIEYLEQTLRHNKKRNSKWLYYYFTLYKLLQNSVERLNDNVRQIVMKLLANFEEQVNYSTIIENSSEYVEHNKCLLKYADHMLYTHQKEVFTVLKTPSPKLVLYIAPTGTGKTLTPVGLLTSHKVIFVCAARHVGLALAKSAISVHKKVAFAFGCNSADDIRLHYFAAKEYTVNKRSGSIKKVDNSVGDKVELMICDIKSYLCAMYYMLAFNEKEKIVFYWDEPTITFDYPEHEFHAIIHQNWKENLIPNVVLSSATLPKLHELTETVADFMTKFPEANVHNVVSHDCRKSIPIINNDGYIVMPHLMSQDYDEVLRIVAHCENYLTILRYLDLNEISKFIEYVDKNDFIPRSVKIARQFGSFDALTMQNIKLHYLKVLKNILPGTWGAVYNHFRSSRAQKITPNSGIDPKGNKIRKTQSIGPGISGITGTSGTDISANTSKPLERINSMCLPPMPPPQPVSASGSSAIYVTTKDAYTLTDGPTIFLAQDVEKIAKFCIQQANIPAKIMDDIMEKIEHNNVINANISQLEKELEDALEENTTSNENKKSGGGKDKGGNDKKMERMNSVDNVGTVGVSRLKEQIENLTGMIKSASLNNVFVPNKPEHIAKWAEEVAPKNVFTCDIEEDTIVKIMGLTNVQNSWKVLLLIGIGVFTNHENIAYTEIMKTLADQQKLFMIISSSDYIYGTNYQFCHGYISKDMNLTQEKIIQAMGRIGRNNIQQHYSIRCRDDDQIAKLFTAEADKPEVINMNILFNSKEVAYDGANYIEK